MAIVQLLYTSEAIKPQSREDLQAILNTSVANNKPTGITGLLLYSQGNFIQVVEGPKPNVDRLFKLISTDKRHHNIEKLLMRPIAERTFYSWKMGLIEVGEHQSLDREKIRKLITLCRTPGSNMGKNEAISAVLKSFRQQLSSAEATLGRVLVVEDHSRLRSLLKTILRQKSSEVVTVDSAESAWKILNSRKFDLVVTDWKLPGKTGVDLVVQMRENPALSTVPVVLISGWADAVDIVSVEQMGVDAFLPKPFTEAQLYARAIAAIEQRKKSEHDSKKGLKL